MNMHGIIQYAAITTLLLIIGYEHIVNVNILLVVALLDEASYKLRYDLHNHCTVTMISESA